MSEDGAQRLARNLWLRPDAQTVFAGEAAEASEDPNWFIALCGCLSDSFGIAWNTLEPVGLDASKNLAPEERFLMARMASGVLALFDDLLQNLVAAAKAPRMISSTPRWCNSWRTPSRPTRLGMFFRSLLQIESATRHVDARAEFLEERLSH